MVGGVPATTHTHDDAACGHMMTALAGAVPGGTFPSDTPMTLHAQAVGWFHGLQDRLCAAIEAADGTAKFREDAWERPGGGGGRSRVMENGGVFEKAGINFSEVHGEFSPDFAKSMPGDGLAFTATGVSWVLHPRNPHVPTVPSTRCWKTWSTSTACGSGCARSMPRRWTTLR
jgi:coproporphyrinogen III oxidase